MKIIIIPYIACIITKTFSYEVDWDELERELNDVDNADEIPRLCKPIIHEKDTNDHEEVKRFLKDFVNRTTVM